MYASSAAARRCRKLSTVPRRVIVPPSASTAISSESGILGSRSRPASTASASGVSVSIACSFPGWGPAELGAPTGGVLGLAGARSPMAMRTSRPRLPECDMVQLTGALSLPADDSSIELVRALARRSNGQAFFSYAPMVLPDAATARVLRTQPDVARAIERYPDLTKAVIGVGAWRRSLSTVVDALTEHERREIYDLGVRGELSGVQIDGQGNPVTTPLTDRLIGIEAGQLHA